MTITLLVNEKPRILKTNELERVLDTYMVQAFVTIHCSKADESNVLQKLEEIPKVIEADMLVGNYEIICKDCSTYIQ